MTAPTPAHPSIRPTQQILELNQTEIIGEVEDARAFLSDCGLPDYSLAGFRAPYLESDPGLRRALKNAKFEYDR